MESVENTGVEGDGRGRQLQGSELQRSDEAKEEGKRDGRKGRIRRATFDDLNAIMDIKDDIYEGLDYMPALFYTFMQSKLHVLYIYEEDGKLISLAGFRLLPDCVDLASGMAGRVRASYEGRDLGIASTAIAYIQLVKEHPAITRYVGVKVCIPEVSAKLHELEVKYHWNVLFYKLADRQWMNRSTRFRQMTFRANRPFSLSYASATEWLERSDQLVRFISKYVTDLFPCGSVWVPTPANRSGLRHMLMCNTVYISMDRIPTIDSSYPCNPITGGGNVPRRRRDREQKGDVVGLSYSTVCTCKYGLKIDIFFYGDCQQLLLSHFYSHLLHYNSITSADTRFGISLNFPKTIDSNNAEELLNEEMGIENYREMGVTQAVLFINDIPSARL